MATSSEIIDQIEALATHCRPPLMEAGTRAAWLADWCNDLSAFPLDAIRAGCQKWRQTGPTKFPTAAQLMPMIRAGLPREPLPVAEPPWTPLTQEQFQALDLPAKIRHHRIMAHEAFARAGPMWANGKPRHAHQMPPKWRDFQQRGNGHEAEAAELAKSLRFTDRRAPSAFEADPYYAPEDAQSVGEMARALASELTREERPSLPSIAGIPDETGLTPQMRALIERQG